MMEREGEVETQRFTGPELNRLVEKLGPTIPIDAGPCEVCGYAVKYHEWVELDVDGVIVDCSEKPKETRNSGESQGTPG